MDEISSARKVKAAHCKETKRAKRGKRVKRATAERRSRIYDRPGFMPCLEKKRIEDPLIIS